MEVRMDISIHREVSIDSAILPFELNRRLSPCHNLDNQVIDNDLKTIR